MASPAPTPELRPLLRRAAISLATLLFCGTIGYRITGGPGWSFFDAFYMTVLTISTAGFMEIHPLGTGGRIVAIALIFVGVGTLIYLTTRIAEAVLHGDAFRLRRHARRIARMHDHVIVCGYGRVGRAIGRVLRHQDVPHVVIDVTDQAEDTTADAVVMGDATDDDTLRAAGIERARGLVAVLRSDADNIYTVLAARSLRPDIFILSRCSQERSASKLRAAGADRVINPYERGGSLMAEVLLRPHVVDVVDQMFRGAGLEVFFEEVRVSAESALAGRSLKDSPIRRELDIIVTAIVKPGGGRSFNPSPDAVIDAADTLIVLGRSDAIDRLRTLASGR